MNTAESSTPTSQPRLLLVDDDPAMIRIVGEMLAEFPDQRFATSGESAIALARESTPDLILLDANLPNMTGFDVCELLKRDPKLANVPVIFVTSHDAPALEADAFRMGASDYVIKPLVAARLQARVRAQLRPRQRVMQIAARLQNGGEVNLQPPQASTRVLAILDTASAETHHDALEAIGALDLASDCASALVTARQTPPGIIVLDAHCAGAAAKPDAAGDVVRALLAAHPHVPVVVLADTPDIDTERALLDAGAADVIAHPLRPAILQARMRAALASALRAEEEIRALLDRAKHASVHSFPNAPHADD
jgi:two-component system, cell cycle response regulator